MFRGSKGDPPLVTRRRVYKVRACSAESPSCIALQSRIIWPHHRLTNVTTISDSEHILGVLEIGPVAKSVPHVMAAKDLSVRELDLLLEAKISSRMDVLVEPFRFSFESLH